MMTSTISGNACVTIRPAINRRRSTIVMAKQANAEETVSSRRAIMLGVATAAIVAVGSIQRNAVAGEEPKPGTPEARKKYKSVCVTMPTAKICHN